MLWTRSERPQIILQEVTTSELEPAHKMKNTYSPCSISLFFSWNIWGFCWTSLVSSESSAGYKAELERSTALCISWIPPGRKILHVLPCLGSQNSGVNDPEVDAVCSHVQNIYPPTFCSRKVTKAFCPILESDVLSSDQELSWAWTWERRSRWYWWETTTFFCPGHFPLSQRSEQKLRLEDLFWFALFQLKRKLKRQLDLAGGECQWLCNIHGKMYSAECG